MPRACRRKLDALKYPILSALRKRTDSCKLSKWCVWLFHTCRTRKRVPLSSPGHPATKRVSPCWKLRKLEFGRHLKPCGKKNFGCWCFRVTTHFGWGSGLRRERAKQGARPTFTTEFQIFAKLQEAFLLPAGEWTLLGSRRWGLQQQPCSRCCTAKSKQHLRHKQRMMIHPEWNQRSLSHVSDTLVTRCQWPPILFPVSITSKGQINEGCLLCNG